ncbi:hypothetical protein QBZ16_002545 [Prototheca wickerhamii]|uniref:Thioredoxin domain-containing protein n=1 Tax=Prototheca wickerhamii TaxID=3111 RepID=A0AAD9IDS4_PROWI|nr:hypothetical protein QBZ16_002545 [Prototheca wickerhamii]
MTGTVEYEGRPEQTWSVTAQDPLTRVDHEYGDRASFLTLEQNYFPAITKEYDISIMPTTIYFQNGTRIATFVGNNRQGFRDFIEKYVSAT